MTNTLSNKVVDTQELLPCPFCGGDELSHGWQSPGMDGSMNTGTVECHSCSVLLYADTEAEAIRAWNTRTTQCSGDTQEVERACCGSREDMPHFWDCETNDPANAHLIAAAPELLEAAEQLIEVAKLGNGVTADALNQLLDAIAKAKGGAK